jgi:hypothetical protein
VLTLSCVPLLVTLLWGVPPSPPSAPPSVAMQAVVFAHGPGTAALIVPIACLAENGTVVAAATSDCLGFVPAKAQVALDSGQVATASERVIATCPGGDGAPRDGLELSGGPYNFSYAVWPVAAAASIARVSHRPPDNLPIAVPAAEYREVHRLVERRARGDLDVLQRFESDLDGDGARDIVLAVDVRCTSKPGSCFNGLIVRWAAKGPWVIVAQDWDLGQVGAVFDLDGNHHPEVLVFAAFDKGFRRQVFTVENRKLKPFDPWCCGCVAHETTTQRR